MTPRSYILFLFFILVIGIPFWPAFVAAGYLIEIGKMNFWTAVLTGTAGNFLGNLIGYWLGAKPGRNLLKHFLRYDWASKALETAGSWLRRYEGPLVQPYQNTDYPSFRSGRHEYKCLRTLFSRRRFQLDCIPTILKLERNPSRT